MAIPALPPVTGYDFHLAVEHPDCYVGVYNLNPGDGFTIRTYTKDGNLTPLGTYTAAYSTQYHVPNDMLFSSDDNSVWISHGAYGVAGYNITSGGTAIAEVARTTEAMGGGSQDYEEIAITANHVWAIGRISGIRVFARNGVASINTTSVFNYTDGELWQQMLHFPNAGLIVAGTSVGNWHFYDDSTFGSLSLAFGGDSLSYADVTADFIDINVRGGRTPYIKWTRGGIQGWNYIKDDQTIVQIANYDPVNAPNPYLALLEPHEPDMWCYMRMNDVVPGAIQDSSHNKRDFTSNGNASIIDPIFNTHTVDNTTDGALFSDDLTWYASYTNASWANGNAFTISAWFYLDDFTNFQEIVNSNNGPGGAVVMIADWNSGRLWAGRHISSGWQNVVATNLEPGRLYHAVMTYSNIQGIKLYIDGVLRGTNSNTSALSGTQTLTEIGREVYHDQNTAPVGQHRLNGAIGEVFILNKELSAGDIAALYNEGMNNPRAGTYDQQILDLSPRAYFPMDEYGGHLMDLSGNAYKVVPNSAMSNAASYQQTGQVGDCIFINGEVDSLANFYTDSSKPIFPAGTNTFAFDVWIKSEIFASPPTTYNRFIEFAENDYTNAERFWFGDINETTAVSTDARRIYAGTDRWTPVVPATQYSIYNNQRGNGTWHHYAVNYDGPNGKIQFFIDSVLANEITGITITPTTKDLAMFIGNIGTVSANASTKARFQKLAVYNTPLTPEQVRANYEKGKEYTPPVAVNKYEQTIYEDEPFSYWPLDEVTGGAALDRMGRNIYLNIVNGSADTMTTTGLIAGDTQPCFQFNGTDQYLFANSALGIHRMDQYTIEALVSTDEAAGTRRDIFGVAENGGYVLDKSSSGIMNTHVKTELSGAFNDADDDHVMVVGQVYHVAATYDGRYLRLYVNGIFRGEYDNGGTSNVYWDRLCAFAIGAQWNTSSISYNWFGKIGHAAIYDKVIPEDRFRKRFLLALGIDNDSYDDRTDYEKAVVDDAPVLFYNITDRRAGAGVMYDMMQNHYASINGTPTPDTSIIPGSASLNFAGDASDEYIRIPDSPLVGITNKLSFEIWAKGDNASGYRGQAQTYWDIGAIMFRRDSFGFHPSGAGTWTNTVNVYINDGSWNTVSFTVPNPDQWNHMVCTWDGVTGFMKVYLNGALVGEITGVVGSLSHSSGTGITDLFVGSDEAITYTNRRFDGSLDMPAVYDSTLTPEQVLEHYLIGRSNQFPASDAYSTLVLSHPSIAAYWRMDDLQTGDELIDIVGGVNWTPTDVTREVPGAIQNGIYLPGGTSDVRITGQDVILENTTQSWSIEGWFKIPAGGRCTINRGRDGQGAGWSISMVFTETSCSLSIVTTSAGAQAFSSTITEPFETDRWYHIALVYRYNNQMNVFINGGRMTFLPMTTSSLRQSSYGWNLGHQNNSDAFYEGYYDELAIYKDAYLDFDEIQSRVAIGFDVEAALTESDDYSALIDSQIATRYWKMNEANGPSLMDTGIGGSQGRIFAHVSNESGLTWGEPSIIPTSTRTCLRFDGVSDASTRLRAGILGFNQRFCYTFWIKPDVAGAEGFILNMNSYYADATANFPFGVLIDPTGNISVNFSQGNDYSADLTLNGKVRNGETNHVGVYWNATDDIAQLWINGVLVDSGTPTFTLSTPEYSHSMCIGAPSKGYGAGENTKYLRGCWLQDVALFDNQIIPAQLFHDQYETGMGADNLNAAIAVNSPVARWRLDDTSGDFVDDYGTYTYTPTNVNYGGPALNDVSNGSMSLVNVANHAGAFDGSSGQSPLAGQTQWTIEAWIQQNSTTDSGYIYVEAIMSSGRILEFKTTNDGRLVCNFHNGSTWGTTIVSVDRFHPFKPNHVAWTRNGNVGKLYINGRLSYTGDMTLTNGLASNADGVAIGQTAHLTQDLNGFPGYIDDVVVYRTALSDSDIKNHFEAGFLGTNYDKVLAETNAYFHVSMDDNLAGNKTTDELRNIPFTHGGNQDVVVQPTGFNNAALTFDGNNHSYNDLVADGHYVRADDADMSGFSLNNSFTGSAWVKANLKTNGDISTMVMSQYNNTEGSRVYMYMQTDTTNGNLMPILVHVSGPTWNQVRVGTNVPGNRVTPGEWTHLAWRCEYSGGNATVTLFKNGVEVVDYNNPQTFAAGSMNLTGYPLSIGEIVTSSTSYYHFDGDIDEVIYHQRALSNQEILDLYNALADEFQMTGIVTQDGVLAQRQVYVYRRDTGQLVAKAQSVSGVFDIRWREIFPAAEYFIVALDDQIAPDLQPIAHDFITPTLVP